MSGDRVRAIAAIALVLLAATPATAGQRDLVDTLRLIDQTKGLKGLSTKSQIEILEARCKAWAVPCRGRFGTATGRSVRARRSCRATSGSPSIGRTSRTRPVAAFVSPGHPLLDATIDLTLERHHDLLKLDAVLVDPHDEGIGLRVLVGLDQCAADGRRDRHGRPTVVARELHFVELMEEGAARDAGAAPYLDYRPTSEAERAAIEPLLDAGWLTQDLEKLAETYAIQHLVPGMLAEVRTRRLAHADKVEREVESRLKRAIMHWDCRAEDLKYQEQAGKKTRLPSGVAARRAEDLAGRLELRKAELAKERAVTPLPPIVISGALVVPIGLLRTLGIAGREDLDREPPEVDPARRAEIERLAMAAVMAAERTLGFEPHDVGSEKRGYDIESRTTNGHLRFIEVKGVGSGNAAAPNT